MSARTEFEARIGRCVSQTVYHCQEAGLAAHMIDGMVTLRIEGGVLQSLEWAADGNRTAEMTHGEAKTAGMSSYGAPGEPYIVDANAQPERFVPDGEGNPIQDFNDELSKRTRR